MTFDIQIFFLYYRSYGDPRSYLGFHCHEIQKYHDRNQRKSLVKTNIVCVRPLINDGQKTIKRPKNEGGLAAKKKQRPCNVTVINDKKRILFFAL